MLDAVKRYATKVLLLHLLLLAVVIFGVVVGTRQVYTGAQREAQEESAAPLRVIGQQTSAAIEAQYQSIADDMEILLRDNSAATQPATEPAADARGATTMPSNLAAIAATRPALARAMFVQQNAARGGRGTLFGRRGGPGGGQIPVTANMVNDMWAQLQGRISQLFVVDNQTGEVTQSLPNDKHGTAEALTKAHLDWFKSLKTASMKAFGRTADSEDSSGYHLLAIPTVWMDRGRGGRGGIGGAATRAARGDETAANSDEEAGGRGLGYGRGGRQGRGFGPGGMRGGGPGMGGGWGPGMGDPNGMGPRGGFGGPEGFGPGGGPGGEGMGPGGPGPDGGPGMGGAGMGGAGMGSPGMGQGMDQAGLGGRGMVGPEANGGLAGERELPFNGPGGGPNGEAVQAPPIDARTVVAVLSLDKVRKDFFDPLNHERGAEGMDANGNAPEASVVNAMLVDQKGDVLVSISGRWVGTNMMTDLDAGMRDAIAPFIQEGKRGSYVMQKDARLGNETLPARIIWFEPVELPSGQKWTVMTMSPVADADARVNRLFSSAFQWAVFVSVAVAGILFSSSVFMIRSRVRLERAQHEVITKELQQARNIQLAWLPGENETPAGIDVSAVNLPASHISGDFYNWFALDGAGKGKVAVVIGDVTGHGMAAAFLMATTQLLVKVALQRTQDPGACLGIVNKQLCTQGFSGQFVTMIVVVLEPGSGAVEVATAGHPAPLLQRDGEFAPMEVEPSLVLGVDAKETYKTHGFVAEAGATMILYTDGVVEAECEDGEQYGVERLVEAVNRSAGGKASGGTGRPDQRVKGIVEDVKKFCGAKDLLDDLTVVAVRVG